jgi:hypothetical protein
MSNNENLNKAIDERISSVYCNAECIGQMTDDIIDDIIRNKIDASVSPFFTVKRGTQTQDRSSETKDNTKFS